MSFGGFFKLFYHGVDEKRNGVGIILKEEYINRVEEKVRRVISMSIMCQGSSVGRALAFRPQGHRFDPRPCQLSI